MDAAVKTTSSDEARQTEIAYHQRQNRIVIFIATPSILFYGGFYYYLGKPFQALLFVLMLTSSYAGLFIGYRIIKTVKSAIIHKRVNAGIWFALLAANLLTGLWDPDIYYVVLPWVFLYPVAAIMFLSSRLGYTIAISFCALALAFFLLNSVPPIDARNIKLLQLSVSASLLSLLVVSIIYEKIRLNVQNELAISQNEYRLAELRQRETNVELQQEIELRRQSEKALAESELHYRALFEESSVALWEENWSQVKAYLDTLKHEYGSDLTQYLRAKPEVLQHIATLIKTTAANRAALKLFSIDHSGAIPVNLFEVLKGFSKEFLIEQLACMYAEGRHHAEISGKTATGGSNRYLMVMSALPAGYEQSWEKVFTSIYDLTERITMEEEKKRVDEQMQNARQIQAVATLAGGIAHQFNNALAVIYGSLDLLEMNAQGNLENRRFITSLKTSAGRMSRLTDQLLAYAEGGKYQPQNFSVNDLITDIINSKMMVRDSSIDVYTELQNNVSLTTGDVTQIKMVIEVVLSNAFEALNKGGQVKITTGRRTVEAQQPDRQMSRPGDYTFISVEDNGAGMQEETLQRIFEPFFTTKIYGRGLGMSAAFGIVRNHDGMITVDSELGKGTKVVIYLPCADSHQQTVQSHQ